MMQRFDWNDLRAFLAVVRAGRLTAAAQTLHVDHSTLSRQIGRLEASLKTHLFERRPTGYTLTNAGEWLVKEAEAIESLTVGIQSQLSDKVLNLAGSVRIGAPEGFGTYYLAPRIGQLATQHPELEIELIANPRVVSLSRREADMAVTNLCPKEGRLFATKLTDYELGLYGSRQYVDTHAPIRCREDIEGHTFIGYIPDLLPTFAHAYLGEVSPQISPRIRISNILTQVAASWGGAGLCIVPCFMAKAEPSLVRLLREEIRITREFWLIIHSDLRDVARVRTAADFIIQQVRSERRLFLPESSQ
jgi:DNA-binding transcriptional LysR family regulator